MADPTNSEMISAIKTTLLALYARKLKSMTMEERQSVNADIAELENSLKMWESRQAAASGSRPRVASIRLDGSL